MSFKLFNNVPYGNFPSDDNFLSLAISSAASFAVLNIRLKRATVKIFADRGVIVIGPSFNVIAVILNETKDTAVEVYK